MLLSKRSRIYKFLFCKRHTFIQKNRQRIMVEIKALPPADDLFEENPKRFSKFAISSQRQW
jgi:hypothetical protein